MWKYPTQYDVIVVGAGHGGCEAAYAAAKMGARTLLLTMNLDTIAKMSCNPSIGGIAKGHIVREIDAIGGIMGQITDKTGIHFRMLNASKGPAVQSPRAQIDKHQYYLEMKHFLEQCPNLEIKQATVISIEEEHQTIIGVKTQENIFFTGKSVVITAGTFMQGTLFIGHTTYPGGRFGDSPALQLSKSLKEKQIVLGRLKTGTPPRINRRSIDLSKLEIQPGEDTVQFSFWTKKKKKQQVPCYIAYTNKKTHEIIHANIKKCALYSGLIQGKGPRYCPSIEDKVKRFADKERHQIFLEPEGLHTEEFYANGLSSSMPIDVQMQIVHSIQGLENAEIMRPAYAIEYDYVLSGQLFATLESKTIKNLFFAGQVNGTTGYEEAAGQGLIAGINAACNCLHLPAFILKRSESYIGVMIDDLITKNLDEPYRMFTSRAEYRLLLRQDNADLRLSKYGHTFGLLNNGQYQRVQKKEALLHKEKKRLFSLYTTIDNKKISFGHLLRRPEITYQSLCEKYPDDIVDHQKEMNALIETEIKFEGYLSRQEKEIEKMKHLEQIVIPKTFAFASVTGLRNEAKEKLSFHRPPNLASASRLIGICPADISILRIAIERQQQKK